MHQYTQNGNFNINIPMDRFFLYEPIIKKKEERKKIPNIIHEPIKYYRVEGIADDFYSSLIDWSGGMIAYAVRNRLHFIDFYTSENKLYRCFKDIITSLKFNKEGEEIAVGFSSGSIFILNIIKHTIKRVARHEARVGCLQWDGTSIVSGSRDRSIRIYDKRQTDFFQMNIHDQEICGIALNVSGTLLASGGNDNRIYVVDKRIFKTVFKGEHSAAVKALTFSNRNILLTGGGTADRKIKMWDLNINQFISEKNMGAQICNLYWTSDDKIISTYGYSHNDVKILSPSLKEQKNFCAHKNRVIQFAVNNDESFFVTASSDNFLRVWEIDEYNKKKNFR